jgi:hypothetical protein
MSRAFFFRLPQILLPQTIQPSQSPFNLEIRPFNVYCLLTSLLGWYRPPCPAGARPFLRRRWSLSRQICRPFVFITLQIPLLACPPRRPFIFMLLQIPFPAKPVFSDSYKTPGGCQRAFIFIGSSSSPTKVISLWNEHLQKCIKTKDFNRL